MVRLNVIGISLILLMCGLFLPAASAQQASGIAGVVRDTSGGVLPGVTVEASSPALIEKIRTVFTDGEGRYNIVDLRPGAYTVTFSLAGFGAVRREGVELTSGFTATVNAELQVGALEETVTVTGASPLVDTQNVRRQTVLSRNVLDTLPTSTKHVYTLVTLTPGFTGITDVGGRYLFEPGSFHGKRGTKVSFDSMGIENSSGNSSYQFNAAVVEEMVLQTSGISAEVNADGPVMNVIPKEGGNTFTIDLSGLYTNHHLESENLTRALRARGLATGNKMVKIFDKAVSAGGPIKRDRLWFFSANRSWGMARQNAGVYWNKTQHIELTPPGAERVVVPWTPWVDRPLDRTSGRWEWYDSYLLRLTWQASPKHKFNVLGDIQEGCNCGSTIATSAQEAPGGTGTYRFDPNRLMQVTWSSPQTSRLLLEAGTAAAISQWNTFWMPGVRPDHIAITDQGLGISYGALTSYRGHPSYTNRFSQRFSASYVTGSHAFKTGILIEELAATVYFRSNGDVSYTFRNGGPVSLTQRATPYLQRDRATELGLYAQDQWTIDRLTLNLGVRFDYFNGYVPAQEVPGTTKGWPGTSRVNPWVPARSFGPVHNVPEWKDIDPRVSAAYDLFGNGRTALKMSLGRYVAKTNTDVPSLNNPITTSVNSVNRSWGDANRNYVPDCDLGNFEANGECEKIDNVNFGQNNPGATRWSDEVLRGWGARDSNWDFSAEVQQELLAGLAMTTGYYHNTGGYFRNSNPKVRVTDNLAVEPSDFDPYCITAPVDPRLPGGGGYQVCGLYDIKPAKFGQAENLVTRTSQYGNDARGNDFFNVTVNGRLGGGIQLGGGFDTGRSVTDRCFVVDSPRELLYCRVVTPFKAQTQVKLYGTIPLPGDFVVSGVYQNMSGPAVDANYAVPTAEIAPSLGRNLAGGTRSATVPLVAPQTLFEDRTTRLDLRVSKVFRVGRVRLQANLDAYNALNSSSIVGVNTTFGARWREPNAILDPRIIQVGGQITF